MADLMSARIAQSREHKMTSPKILAVGGAHVDRRGQMTGAFVPGASIPGTMRDASHRPRAAMRARRRKRAICGLLWMLRP